MASHSFPLQVTYRPCAVKYPHMYEMDVGPFAVSDSRLPQPGEPNPRIYIPPRNRCPSYIPRHWVRFSSPPTIRRATDRTENHSSIIACSLAAIETRCPQSCSLATAVVLSPVYTAVTWQRSWYNVRYCPITLVGRMRKLAREFPVRVASPPAEIRTGHFTN
jgi:hypothetical protein